MTRLSGVLPSQLMKSPSIRSYSLDPILDHSEYSKLLGRIRQASWAAMAKYGSLGGFFPRNLLAFATGLRQPNGDGLFAILDFFPGTTASKRPGLHLVHCLFDLLFTGLTIFTHHD